MSLINNIIEKEDSTKLKTTAQSRDVIELLKLGDDCIKLNPPNYVQAMDYYKKAEQLNSVAAKTKIGVLYREGLGVDIDYDKAIKYFLDASENGDLNATFNYASMLYVGQGVEQNYNEAMLLFSKISGYKDTKKMCRDAISVSNLNLGVMYRDGLGVKANYITAKEYFEEAAKLHNHNAITAIGEMYDIGLGVEQDQVKAVEYFEKAADMGNSSALINLAIHYINGKVVERDLEKARNCLQRSLDLGNYVANFIYGAMYYYGYGDAPNYEQAKKHFESFYKVDSTHLGTIFYLIDSYLKLYYYGLANMAERKKDDIVTNRKNNRDNAIKYLDVAKKVIQKSNREDLETFKKRYKIYKSVIDTNNTGPETLNYKTFKKLYYNKFLSIFQKSKFNESQMFDEFKNYFKLKDEKWVTRIINEELRKEKQKFKQIKRKNLVSSNANTDIKKVLDNRSKDIKSNIDFSSCVIILNKLIENTLQIIFKEGFNKYVDEQKSLISTKVNDIIMQINVLPQESITKLYGIMDKNDYTQIKYTDRIFNDLKGIVNKLQDFSADKSRRDAQCKVKRLSCIVENSGFHSSGEVDVVKSLLNIDKDIKNLQPTLESQKQQKENVSFGQFANSVYVNTNSKLIGYVKHLDPNCIKFVKSINSTIEEKDLVFKLNELISKVELYRVIVRNDASHGVVLSKESVEEGLKIAIMQEGSILSLIDEIFGEYLCNLDLNTNKTDCL